MLYHTEKVLVKTVKILLNIGDSYSFAFNEKSFLFQTNTYKKYRYQYYLGFMLGCDENELLPTSTMVTDTNTFLNNQ